MLLTLAIVLAVVIICIRPLIVPNKPEKFKEWLARRPRLWG